MRKNLNKNGLSLSQAQSISNLCNQRTQEINNKISTYNNYSKIISYESRNLTEKEGIKIDSNIVNMLQEKGRLHACQAFLMENIKAKDDLLTETRNESFEYQIEYPKHPELEGVKYKKLVDEQWGWMQLTKSEYNEFLEVEAMASHIGQFIHKGGKLDSLRKELPNLPSLEWFEIKKDEKTPVIIKKHHTSEDLLNLHEDLSKMHREYEQRVNYFKAKVKNLITEENAKIEEENSKEQLRVSNINDKLMNDYNEQLRKHEEAYKVAYHKFESEKHKKIKEIAKLKIEVEPRFQSVIDMFLEKEN
jgi:hypothetical protein